MRKIALSSVLAATLLACSGPKDGEYSFQVLTTNDIHGTYFDSTYIGPRVKNSLFAVKHVVDSVRSAIGQDNVILLDAGDILQGDNAAYYFNYVDTLSPHVYPRMAAYMGYDAIAVGNHDVETGHPVYDRVRAELEESGIPFLGGNAIRNDNGKPYFQPYTIIKRNGVKVAVLGYSNANIKNWLSEDIWEGMTFKSLVDVVQDDVDKVMAKERPHIVIVACHSATGEGDGSQLESEGLDLFNSLRGVDLLVCSHDHKPFVTSSDSMALVNSGSHCRYVGKGQVDITVKDGEVVSKSVSSGLIPVDSHDIDREMAQVFHPEYTKVKEFTTAKVGSLDVDLVTRDAYAGMSDYVNLLHAIALRGSSAEISIAAPLTFDKTVKSGELIFNDLFTIYPFENQLFVAQMQGSQLKDYLEVSYDRWIKTYEGKGNVLNIKPYDDPRTGQEGWSFVERAYNFDSAAGLVYTVDVTKPKGERVDIVSMADGSDFVPGKVYSVAMTSYRANGGGNLLREAGVAPESLAVTERLPEIRDLIYDYLKENGAITHEDISDPKLIGGWKFVPENVANKVIANDLSLLFRERQ